MKIKNPVNLSIATIEDLAYIAGFVDGEGTIYKAGGSGQWRVSVPNTNEELIRWLQGFGGNVHAVAPIGISKKKIYRWVIQNEIGVLSLCNAIAPFMIIKKSLAIKAVTETTARRLRRASPKPCSGCGNLDVEFGRNGPYRRSKCKDCINRYHRVRYAAQVREC